MNGLETALLRRRVEVLESIVEQAGLLEAIAGGRIWGHGPIVDPGPEDLVRGGHLGQVGGSLIGRVRTHGDPPPTDVSRLSQVQLQAALHDIAAQRARLDSMEALIREQMGQAGGGGS